MDGFMSQDRENNYTPEGLIVRRQGEALEEVSSKLSNFKLLNSSGDFEITEITLKPEVRLTLTPVGTVTETFFVLSGKLSYNPTDSQQVFIGGDCIITKSLIEPVILTAVTETKLLYVTERAQFHEISKDLHELRKLAVEVELKDGYTADHCKRLQDLSYVLGQEIGLQPKRLHLLDYGAYLHDVGKIRIPLSILTKPAKLTPEEWKVIKQHPTYGRELLAQTFMKEAGTIVEQHHERSDGSGYPRGLSGDEILIESSIVAVADTFDAMTTDRPYRKASTQAEALAEIRKYAGIHYPIEVVKAFCSAMKAKKLMEGK